MNRKDRPHVLMLGCIDHTSRTLVELGADYSLLHRKHEVSAHQIHTAQQLVLSDYEDIDLMVEYAKVIHGKRKIDVVLSFCEYAQSAAANIADALGGIPTNCEPFAVENTRNKRRFRELLSRERLSNVPWRVVGSVAELQAFKTEVRRGVIVKPISGSASEGVHYVDDDDDLPRAYRHAASVNGADVLAEKYVDGDEYSVESISIGGRHEVTAITRKSVSGIPHFVEMGHVQPCLPARGIDEIHALASGILTALGHRHGPAHTEVKINASGTHVIESHVRAGGDQIWEMTMLTAGVDFVRETFCSLFDMPRPERKPKFSHVAIQYFVLPASAALHDKSALRAAYAPHGQVIRVKVDNMRTNASSGHPASNSAGANRDAPMRSADRSGYIMVHGRTAAEAEALAAKEVDRFLEGLVAARIMHTD